MPNKLTDTEIKKALECCILGDCQGCFYGDTDQRHCNLMQNALDLINRYEKEKSKAWELFKKKCDENIELQMICDKQKAEVERLQGLSKHHQILINELNNGIAEAYKEFADILINEKLAVILLKNVSDEFAIGYETALIDVEQKANNLLNELVGDGGGKRKD